MIIAADDLIIQIELVLHLKMRDSLQALHRLAAAFGMKIGVSVRKFSHLRAMIVAHRDLNIAIDTLKHRTTLLTAEIRNGNRRDAASKLHGCAWD